MMLAWVSRRSLMYSHILDRILQGGDRLHGLAVELLISVGEVG